MNSTGGKKKKGKKTLSMRAESVEEVSCKFSLRATVKEATLGGWDNTHPGISSSRALLDEEDCLARSLSIFLR